MHGLDETDDDDPMDLSKETAERRRAEKRERSRALLVAQLAAAVAAGVAAQDYRVTDDGRYVQRQYKLSDYDTECIARNSVDIAKRILVEVGLWSPFEIVALALGGFVAYAVSCGIALSILKAAEFSGDPEPAAAAWPLLLGVVLILLAVVGPIYLGSRIALWTTALPDKLGRWFERRRCSCSTDVMMGRLEDPACSRHGPRPPELPEERIVQR